MQRRRLKVTKPESLMDSSSSLSDCAFMWLTAFLCWVTLIGMGYRKRVGDAAQMIAFCSLKPSKIWHQMTSSTCLRTTCLLLFLFYKVYALPDDHLLPCLPAVPQLSTAMNIICAKGDVNWLSQPQVHALADAYSVQVTFKV